MFSDFFANLNPDKANTKSFLKNDPVSIYLSAFSCSQHLINIFWKTFRVLLYLKLLLALLFIIL